MYIKEYLKQFNNKKIKLFVDMDGVLADYIFGSAKDYNLKRPLFSNIKKIKKISKNKNIQLFILSMARYSDGINQKHWWLDKYAPFFKKENRIIISREANNMEESATLKAQFFSTYPREDCVLILIDDDPKNLKKINALNEDVILLKDTVLVD